VYMAFGLNGAIHTFQKKIGTYDKANWEIIVEKQSIPQIDNTSSDAKIPTDILDVDLIKGSSFTKTKPGYHWTQVTASGLLKIIFFPVFIRWWKSQISQWVWAFLTLYFVQLFGLVIYFVYQGDESLVDISWPEAFVPIMALILVGELFIHVVSSNFTKPMAHKLKKNTKKRTQDSKRPGRAKDRKKNSSSSKNKKSTTATKTTTSKTTSSSRIRRRDGDGKNDTTSPERHTSREESVERTIRSDDENSIFSKIKMAAEKRQQQVKATDNTNNSIGVDVVGDENNLGFGLRQRITAATTQAKTADSNTDDKDSGFDGREHEEEIAESSTSSDSSSDSESSSNSTSTMSEEDEEDIAKNGDLLGSDGRKMLHVTTSKPICNDQITVSIWSGNSFKKLKLTFFEIGLEVVKQVEIRMANIGSDYVKFSMFSACLIGVLPMLFRVYKTQASNNNNGNGTRITFNGAFTNLYLETQTWEGIVRVFQQICGPTFRAQVVILIAIIGRIASSFCMFFMLCVAEEAYKKRYMYAKFFGAVTSTRRARRNQVPHFRLHKVKNIKAWLSLRSFLKKRGPQRSVDTIVSAAFILGILLLVICCVQFLSVNDQKEHFLSYFFSWEVSIWGLALGVFLIRFIALGSDINRKYRNSSILLTEQINLYLQMEKNPEKKEEYMIANNVLKLALDLLKELDSSFKISGFIMNPLLSNITRVVVLSLFSGVMSDILGFRLRLWKIKV